MISDSQIKAIIFDLDGTIYNKKRIQVFFGLHYIFNLKLFLTYLKIRKDFEGIDFGTQDDFNKKLIKELSLKTNKSKDRCQIFIKKFLIYFVKVLKRSYKAYPEITEAIDFYHKKGTTLICLSDYPMVKERLVALGVDPNKFTLLKSSEEYGALKPNPKSFLQIAEFLNFAPSNFVIVGDRDDTDGEGARRSNMHFVKFPENFKTLKEYTYNEKS